MFWGLTSLQLNQLTMCTLIPNCKFQLDIVYLLLKSARHCRFLVTLYHWLLYSSHLLNNSVPRIDPCGTPLRRNICSNIWKRQVWCWHLLENLFCIPYSNDQNICYKQLQSDSGYNMTSFQPVQSWSFRSNNTPDVFMVSKAWAGFAESQFAPIFVVIVLSKSQTFPEKCQKKSADIWPAMFPYYHPQVQLVTTQTHTPHVALRHWNTPQDTKLHRESQTLLTQRFFTPSKCHTLSDRWKCNQCVVPRSILTFDLTPLCLFRTFELWLFISSLSCCSALFWWWISLCNFDLKGLTLQMAAPQPSSVKFLYSNSL